MGEPFKKEWCPPRESNTAPTDYESAALTKHELGGHGMTDVAFVR